jgi:nucleotide-binding universal stress UspA family protein
MKNLLIALDGSKQSEAVLPIALTLARKCEYHPVLLSVWETGLEEQLEGETPELMELTARGTKDLEAYLHGLAPRLDEVGLGATVDVRAGHPAVEIIGAAQDRSAGMIAMCTHGRRAVPGGRRGSIADKVLRGSPVPVLAVGPQAAVPEARMKRILVPLDGSADAEEAIPYAIDLAHGLGSKIDLLRVVTPALGAYAGVLPVHSERELDRHRERVAAKYLDAVRKTYVEKRLTTRVETGFPAAVIAEYVERSNVDLVVMTSHSRYAAGLWTLGGVADSLIDGLAPVVLVRPSTASSVHT